MIGRWLAKWFMRLTGQFWDEILEEATIEELDVIETGFDVLLVVTERLGY
jgi:hypothetical protein